MLSPRPLAVPLAAALLFAAGCGSSSKSKSAETTPPQTASTPAATTQAAAPAAAGGAVPVANATDLKHKPQIGKPHGTAPGALVKKDLVVGHGPAAKAGDNVTVQYVGDSWSNGKQFDASWDRGQPFTFPLGQGQVIQGWDNGVAGMKVGGRRELVIPPDQGYGAQGAPPDIAPNETLVFVVDLKRIG